MSEAACVGSNTVEKRKVRASPFLLQVLPVSEAPELELDISGITFSPSGRRCVRVCVCPRASIFSGGGSHGARGTSISLPCRASLGCWAGGRGALQALDSCALQLHAGGGSGWVCACEDGAWVQPPSEDRRAVWKQSCLPNMLLPCPTRTYSPLSPQRQRQTPAPPASTTRPSPTHPTALDLTSTPPPYRPVPPTSTPPCLQAVRGHRGGHRILRRGHLCPALLCPR